jgi:hypothetical protein
MKDEFEIDLHGALFRISRADWERLLKGAIEAGFLLDKRIEFVDEDHEDGPPRESKRDELLHVATLLAAGHGSDSGPAPAHFYTFDEAVEDAVALITAVDKHLAKERGEAVESEAVDPATLKETT